MPFATVPSGFVFSKNDTSRCWEKPLAARERSDALVSSGTGRAQTGTRAEEILGFLDCGGVSLGSEPHPIEHPSVAAPCPRLERPAAAGTAVDVDISPLSFGDICGDEL